MNGTSHQFCVRWNSHLGSLGAAFPELLAGQYFVDVTLACEGHQLHCHRLVLASCSSYFNSLLRENPCRHPIVILPRDIKLWAIQALVDFMYKGEVNVSQIGLGELLKSAEILQIRGLCGSDANAIFNLNQVPNSNGTDMTMNNNESLQVSSSQLINNNGNGATSTNEQNNSANNDISQQYEALSAYPNRNGISVTNSNNLSQNSQRNSIPSTSGNQFSNTNISKPIRIQRMTTNGFDSANDELNLSLSSQSEENNDNDCVSFNKIIEPKEEPIDENMDDDNMNGDGDMNPDSESGRQDDNSDAGRRSTDYSRLLDEAINKSETENDNLQSSMDNIRGRRVRRSETILRQAAECVSKGQTFQTVSDMFGIPISTIRFFMARKGILPRRKRGRAALSVMGTLPSLTAPVITRKLIARIPITRAASTKFLAPNLLEHKSNAEITSTQAEVAAEAAKAAATEELAGKIRTATLEKIDASIIPSTSAKAAVSSNIDYNHLNNNSSTVSICYL